MIVLQKCSGKFFRGNITTFGYSFKFQPARRRGIVSASLGFFIFFLAGVSFAGFERTAQPASMQGSAQASVFADESESILLNPSSAASLSSFHLLFFYSPSPFDLPQLSSYGTIAAYPGEFLNMALSSTATGFSLYREITATATVAKSFEGIFFTGVSLNVEHVAIARYGSATALGIDLAATAQITDEVRWGFSLLNVNRPSIGGDNDEIPALYITGIAFRLMPTAEISCSLFKDVSYPASLRTGVDFCPIEILCIRAGVSTEPSRYCAGVGVRLSSASFDYSVVTHQELGLTHSLGVSLTF